MIRLTIDDQEIEVREGTMIADAAARLGIDIPVYCYHEALGPLGACRMCLVGVEKMPKLATACTTAVQDGMVVHTYGEAVDKGRKGVLEFLLINHPLDCPVCDKGGECFLQDYTFQYGPPKGRFKEPKIQKVKDGPINEFVLIDQERCVLCQRCVRFMDEYVGEPQLLLDGRGVETVVTTVEGVPATSQFSGNVIDLCPVGALLSAPYQHKGRPWNIERQESVCTMCPVGCTTLATGRDGHIVRIEGRPVPDRSWGWLCDRGRFGYDYATDPTRLTISFLHANPEAAARTTRQVGHWMSDVMRDAGPDSIAVVMGGLHTVEEAHQVHAFAKNVIGTSRLSISRDVPGYVPRVLNGTYADIADADTILLVGVDPYEAVPVVHLKLRERQKSKRPVKILAVAPRDLSRDSLDVNTLITHAGQEAQVLGWALSQGMGTHPAVKKLAATAPVGVADEDLTALSEALGSSEHLTILWDGLQNEVGSVLAALADARGEKATRILPTWGPSNWRGFERAGFSADFDALTSLLEDARAGKIQMLMTFGADLLREYPDERLVREALQKVPHVVFEGLFRPTEPSLYGAQLPQAGPGEVAGTYVNMEARLLSATPSVTPPGQARPVKSYLTAWAHALNKPFVADDDWDPYGDDTADLLPFDGIQAKVWALKPPNLGNASGMELVTGALVIENGIPSHILEPRAPKFPGRISPQDAEILGIVGQGLVRLGKDGREIRVPVTVDERMTPGRIFVPLGMASCPVNRLGLGAVEVARLEEVPTT